MIPVIMTEKTMQYSEHLNVAVERSNFKNRTIVLGDEGNLQCGAEHHMMSDYSYRANKFAEVYTHLNFNPEWMELLCFKRWFVIHDFMEKHDIDVCFHCDSDVLVFVDVNEEYHRFKQFEMTLSGRVSGHTGFFTRNGLKKFCDFMFNVYSERGYLYELFCTIYELRQKHQVQGGVCDMTLLGEYANQNAPTIGEVSVVMEGSGLSPLPFFDHHLRCEEGDFEMVNGKKNIFFLDGLPWCRQVAGPRVPFATIHFQGALMKPLMKEFSNKALKT